MASDPKPRSHPSRTPLAEWIVGGAGLLIVVAMLSILLHHAVTSRGAPPLLTVSAGPVVQTPAGWLQKVRVANGGDHTAASVEVQGDLGEETASATLDYVPAHGSADAALMFQADPRSGGLQLSTSGFTEP